MWVSMLLLDSLCCYSGDVGKVKEKIIKVP